MIEGVLNMFDTNIPLYGIFILLAIICGLIVIFIDVKNLNFKKEEIIGLLLYVFLGAIFGAKYFVFLTNYSKYNGIFDFWKIGLSSYGAVIGVFIMLFLFSKQFKKKFNELLYALLPSIPLMYGIGKIGCFLAGCCHGIKYNGPFHIVYNYSYSAPKGVSLFPVQLVEALMFLTIFFIVFNKVKAERYNNKIIGLTFIICSISKFLLDYLRISHIGKIISINQIISLIFIAIGLFIFKCNATRNKNI